MRPHDKNGYNAGVRFNCFMDVSLRNNKKLPSTTAMENKSMVIADRPYNLQLKKCQNPGWDTVGGLTTS